MDLTQLESHYSFGENWTSFAENVGNENIEKAVASLATLFPNDELKGKTFLDIGCGSGLSMLAALVLGAKEVHGFDIDPNSVKTANKILAKFAPRDTVWSVQEKSILNIDKNTVKRYDIVHSWGVLHHTGKMWDAIDHASQLVNDKGLFVIALYRKTPLCSFWRLEKRIYSCSPLIIKKLISVLYISLYFLRILISFQLPHTFIAEYNKKRGMSFFHDVDDWLGGYPYESVDIEETIQFVSQLGLKELRIFDHCSGTIRCVWNGM